MRTAALLVTLFSLAVVGCLSGKSIGVERPRVVDGEGGLEPGDLSTQRVLRARFQGPVGQGSFRLVLRLAAEDHYQVIASDPIGRQLWAIEFQGSAFRFLDFRGERACETDGQGVTLAGAALDSFPLRELGPVLLGRLPGGLRRASDEAGRRGFRDLQGRFWTITSEGGSTVGWTVWEGVEPLAWLQYRDSSGILSHRQGSQLRWRQTLVEKLEGLERLQVPAGFALVDCPDLALSDEALLIAGGEN